MSKSSTPTPQQLNEEGRKFSDAGDRASAARSFSREGDAYTEPASKVRASFTAFVEAPDSEKEGYRAKLDAALISYNERQAGRDRADEEKARADFVQRSQAKAHQFAAKGDQFIDGLLAPNNDRAQNVGLLTKAATQYEGASKFDATNPVYHDKHGHSHYALGAIHAENGNKKEAAQHYQHALASFTKAATLDPRNPDYPNAIHDVHQELGNPAQAAEAAKKADALSAANQPQHDLPKTLGIIAAQARRSNIAVEDAIEVAFLKKGNELLASHAPSRAQSTWVEKTAPKPASEITR